MATVNLDLGELMSFMVNAGQDWQKTGKTQGMKTKSPTTGQVTQYPTGFGQRALSAGRAGIMPQTNIMERLGIQLPPATKRQTGFSMSDLLMPQQGKQGGGDMMSSISNIMSILALLGI